MRPGASCSSLGSPQPQVGGGLDPPKRSCRGPIPPSYAAFCPHAEPCPLLPATHAPQAVGLAPRCPLPSPARIPLFLGNQTPKGRIRPDFLCVCVCTAVIAPSPCQ